LLIVLQGRGLGLVRVLWVCIGRYKVRLMICCTLNNEHLLSTLQMTSHKKEFNSWLVSLLLGNHKKSHHSSLYKMDHHLTSPERQQLVLAINRHKAKALLDHWPKDRGILHRRCSNSFKVCLVATTLHLQTSRGEIVMKSWHLQETARRLTIRWSLWSH